MTLKQLKPIRVVISLLFFVLIIIGFLDISHQLPEEYFDGVLWLQFVPSLIHYLTLFSFTALGFGVIIVLTVLFGRMYCSTICPLGTLQDVFTFISKKIKHIKYKFRKPANKTRYGILILTVLSYIFGSMLLINLLDPYSNFGRISTNLLRPLYITANNYLVELMSYVDNYYFYSVDIKGLSLWVMLFPAAVLITLIVMSWRRGRLWCNTLCPVGAFLGWLSRYSFFELYIDQKSCNKCGACEKVCKAECINQTEQQLDMSRCVECFNCVRVCPDSSIKFRLRINALQNTDNSRREVLQKIPLGMFVIAAADSSTRKDTLFTGKPTKVPENRQYASTPPGSLSVFHFNAACTACHLCVSACPSNVIQPQISDFGIQGFLQPKMDYHTGYCNYDCLVCGEVCPSGAILPINSQQKKRTQVGYVVFIKENCVIETDGKACGACAEHCPTKAVKMVDYKDNLKIPEVEKDLCVGCGACEYACPTRPYRAIFIEGNPIHLTAKEPEVKELDKKVDYEEDFPF